MTLDLTGLPPTPEEIEAFGADASPDAYEKVVDRLLASPRYGERMAADWLDIARFADTHGYQSDRYRAVWPYRDWVIKAFNENLPFDQFGTWQLAGDLLPNATREQRLATAFNRLHMQNEEGGIVEEEYRVAYNIDRVTTMGTAFLGLTFECSRCHDHKFDPISQRDFYSLFAFFQNVDESGQTSYFTDSTPVPTLLLPTAQQDEQLAELTRTVVEREEAVRSARVSDLANVLKWLDSRSGTPRASGCVASFALDEIKAGKVANGVDKAHPGNAQESPAIVESGSYKGAELDGENGFSFPGVGHFSRSDPFTLSIWLRQATLSPRAVVLHHSKAPIDAGSRGYELLLESGRVAFGLHHMWPGSSLKVVTKQVIPPAEWTHVAVAYDGSSRASGVTIYLDGKPVETEIVRDGLAKDITYGGGEPDLTIGHRFRDNGFKGGMVRDLKVFDRAITPLEAADLAGKPGLLEAWARPPGDLTPAQRDGLTAYYLSNEAPALKEARAALHAARRELARLIEPIPEIMVMRELATPKPCYILKRGAYDAHGDRVTGDTPHFLPPMPVDLPKSRLGLARWLFSQQSPLTARVTVNRLWQQMFGRGIVETSDNFGSQGAAADASGTARLARDRLSRPRVGREANAQADRARRDVSAVLQGRRRAPRRDPANQLLARGPSRRLTAEMLRDQALVDGGLLVEKLGGPSVKPYQPDGLWDVATGKPRYDQSHGPDLYRRSLYSYWKRTVPPPAMVAFDAADRSYCTARRQSTSTPLQALALLNDVTMTESARMIGQRMLREGGDGLEARLAWGFELVTGRRPVERERVVLRRLYSEQHGAFAADPPAAAALLAVGESKPDPALDKIDLATTTVVAEALLSHDEAVMRR